MVFCRNFSNVFITIVLIFVYYYYHKNIITIEETNLIKLPHDCQPVKIFLLRVLQDSIMKAILYINSRLCFIIGWQAQTLTFFAA